MLKVLSVMVVLMLCGIMASIATAQERPPAQFIGTAYAEDGSLANKGVPVVALIDDRIVDIAFVGKSGKFSLRIQQPSDASYFGQPIIFTVDNQRVETLNENDQSIDTILWVEGKINLLNLRMMSEEPIVEATATPAPTPTPTPTPDNDANAPIELDLELFAMLLQGVANYGAEGPEGPRGEQGVHGMPGATGMSGAHGPIGLTGETGPQGAIGEAGTAGEMGQPGAMGASGRAGATGSAGLQGATGAEGPAGLNGAGSGSGSGIAYVALFVSLATVVILIIFYVRARMAAGAVETIEEEE